MLDKELLNAFSNDDEIGRLIFPITPDRILFRRMLGTEGISRLFEWKIEVACEGGQIFEDDFIGHNCSLETKISGHRRYFSGICSELRWLYQDKRFTYYEIIVNPALWLATLSTDCRIFHKKTITDIISEILEEINITDYKFILNGEFTKIDYCVQYQETNFEFISRLMEKHGLFYYFDCYENSHTLVICDSNSGAEDVQPSTPFPYMPDSAGIYSEQHIASISTIHKLRSNEYFLKDYNYETASSRVEATATANVRHGSAGNQHYVYAPGFADHGSGQEAATILLQSDRTYAQRYFATGTAISIGAGSRFLIDDNPVCSAEEHLLCVSASHALVSNDRESGGRISELETYRGAFEVLAWSTPYRTPEQTAWPRISGPHTAKVVSAKDGEEIDVDDQGRILVQFHWVRHQEQSCRVRIAQSLAGNGFGAVVTPRVGQEVLVDFVDGDPDRPVVRGVLYNSDHTIPITLPENKTQSTIKTKSTKGGRAADNFNEIRFEDKNDEEEIYIHAERDRNMQIEHDDDIIIGNNQTEKIGGSRTFELTGGDETITIKGKSGTKDKYGAIITKGGNRTTTLELGNETMTIKEGKRTTKIKMDDERTITDGDDIHVVEKGNQITTIKMGDQKTSIKAGKGGVDAMQKYTIKVGGSKIELTPMKITLKAMQIDIKADMKLDAKGMMTTVQGSAMCTIKGGIVMIN